MMTDANKVVFNKKEAAAYLGLCENSFLKLLKSGRVKYKKAGRRWLIPRKALDEFLSV